MLVFVLDSLLHFLTTTSHTTLSEQPIFRVVQVSLQLFVGHLEFLDFVLKVEYDAFIRHHCGFLGDLLLNFLLLLDCEIANFVHSGVVDLLHVNFLLYIILPPLLVQRFLLLRWRIPRGVVLLRGLRLIW